MVRAFSEYALGKDIHRSQLEQLLAFVRRDSGVIHSLDRLARNLEDLRQLIARVLRWPKNAASIAVGEKHRPESQCSASECRHGRRRQPWLRRLTLLARRSIRIYDNPVIMYSQSMGDKKLSTGDRTTYDLLG